MHNTWHHVRIVTIVLLLGPSLEAAEAAAGFPGSDAIDGYDAVNVAQEVLDSASQTLNLAIMEVTNLRSFEG